MRYPDRADWEKFLSLAAAEDWRVPQIELKLFLDPLARSARVLSQADQFCGLVTAVGHERSGWIGNLIVPASLRNRGYGRRLFEAAKATLDRQGMRSLWLTASELGRPIYEQAGFVAVDQVERWVARGQTNSPPHGGSCKHDVDVLLRADRTAWSEDRQLVLQLLLQQGDVFHCGDSSALLQNGADLQMVGPWYSPLNDDRSNRTILQEILRASDPETELVGDFLASSQVTSLLPEYGFSRIGTTQLMVCGDACAIDLKRMVAMASLGSFA